MADTIIEQITPDQEITLQGAKTILRETTDNNGQIVKELIYQDAQTVSEPVTRTISTYKIEADNANLDEIIANAQAQKEANNVLLEKLEVLPEEQLPTEDTE